MLFCVQVDWPQNKAVPSHQCDTSLAVLLNERDETARGPTILYGRQLFFLLKKIYYMFWVKDFFQDLCVYFFLFF